MCSTKLLSRFPASFDTSNDPNTHTGYSYEDISILKLFRTVFAVPTLKLLPSELVSANDYNLSSALSVPLIDRIKLDPRHTNTYYSYCFSFWSLSLRTYYPPRLPPE
jgi:hypothetical protein